MRPIDEELTLPDGTKITTDDTVMMPDGPRGMAA
jgi:hypothetical protein